MKLIELLEEYSVDLITVAANCLEARNLKRCLESIAGELKNKMVPDDEVAEPTVRKEVLTIWGSTEVPKLFSMSHNSQRMHKNIQQMYKQAISLARFEQDPLCELLNLCSSKRWSSWGGSAKERVREGKGEGGGEVTPRK